MRKILTETPYVKLEVAKRYKMKSMDAPNRIP